MSNSAIIVGGGYSINDGLNLNLWDKIKEKDIWSLNYGYLAMPYFPQAEIWVDIMFFNHNITKLQEMNQKGVKMYAKRHMRHSAITEIEQYFTTRNKSEFHGKKAIEKGIIYVGRMGLSGIFGLSLAIAKGYNTIYLLGYDFGNDNKSNKTHFYQDKLQVISSGVGRPEIYRDNQSSIRKEVEDFDVFNREKEVKILNVSPNSNIPYFEKIDYEKFFNLLENEK